MAIVSSSYVVGIPQSDGRCFVTEFHTDSTGRVHSIEYGPIGAVDYEAIMVARAVQISESLAEAEAEALWL
jgi:hypothetical protein